MRHNAKTLDNVETKSGPVEKESTAKAEGFFFCAGPIHRELFGMQKVVG